MSQVVCGDGLALCGQCSSIVEYPNPHPPVLHIPHDYLAVELSSAKDVESN